MISDSDEDDASLTEKYVKNNDILKKYGWAGKESKSFTYFKTSITVGLMYSYMNDASFLKLTFLFRKKNHC